MRDDLGRLFFFGGSIGGEEKAEGDYDIDVGYGGFGLDRLSWLRIVHDKVHDMPSR